MGSETAENYRHFESQKNSQKTMNSTFAQWHW